jgi:hypothetical protein
MFSLCAMLDHRFVAVFDLLDRGPHSVTKSTGVEDLRCLLAAAAGVAVQLVDAMRAVVHANRLRQSCLADHQHDRVVRNGTPSRRELDSD